VVATHTNNKKSYYQQEVLEAKAISKAKKVNRDIYSWLKIPTK
jgi:hypothetical protein